MNLMGGILRWSALCILVIGVVVLDGSSSGTHGDAALMNGDIEPVLDARSLIPIKQPRFSRRILAFQRANQRKDARQRLPAELVPFVAMYIYYDWKNLVDFFNIYHKCPKSFETHLLECEKAGPELLEWKGGPEWKERVGHFELDSAGDVIAVTMKFRRGYSLRDCADCSKLPPTLTNLVVRNSGVVHLDTWSLPRGLQHLDVSSNFIRTLDFSGLPRRLSSLKIGGNPFRDPRDLDLSALPKGLKELDLAGIEFRELSLQWFPEGLESLVLSCDRLRRFDMSGAGKLKVLTLLRGEHDGNPFD